MINILYEQIWKLFWDSIQPHEWPLIIALIDWYILWKEREIDRIFKQISDLKYKEFKYNYTNPYFYYRANNWIMTIVNSELTDSQKLEIIKNATLLLIKDNDIKNSIYLIIERINQILNMDKDAQFIASSNDIYFAKERIAELKKIKSTFDVSKIVLILNEVNFCYQNSCYLSVSSLLRMLIDHIPPIFWFNSFQEAINSYKFSRSDKKNMEHLLWWLKNISDCNLHGQINNKEVLPTIQTIEFRADFDVLLKNIILKLEK